MRQRFSITIFPLFVIYLTINFNHGVYSYDVLSSLFHALNDDLGICPNPNENTVKFYLTNQNNFMKPLTTYDYYEIDKNKSTIILLTGWWQGFNNSVYRNSAKKLVSCQGCQVIHVNYDVLSRNTYSQAVCSAQKLADYLAKFALESLLLNPKHIECVGVSMGAQICGLMGQAFIKQYGQRIKRISGYDPAGLSYYNVVENYRLNKDDADFVDVIHTSPFPTGYPSSIGTVDFWVNGGLSQPCCPSCTIKDINTGMTVVENLFHVFGCAHVVSLKYYEASICSDIKGNHCGNNLTRSASTCNGQEVTFGHNLSPFVLPGNYYVRIDSV